jgi:hypothetical protein
MGSGFEKYWMGELEPLNDLDSPLFSEMERV